MYLGIGYKFVTFLRSIVCKFLNQIFPNLGEVPFADLSPMECGMRIATEGLRVQIPPGTSSYLTKLINICMNEDPGKRPTFDMIIPILDKMKR